MLACGLVQSDGDIPSDRAQAGSSAFVAAADPAFEAATCLRLRDEDEPGMAATNRIQKNRRYPDLERIAACAAASLAIGTRYGEQDT